MACEHADSIWVSMKHTWCHACEGLFCVEEDGTQTPTPLSLATKLDVFESRQHGWFFEPIRKTLEIHGATPMRTRDAHGAPVAIAIPVGEFVALNALLAYFEGIEKYRNPGAFGERENGKWFTASATRVLAHLGVSTSEIADLWPAVRNTLSHEGMTYSLVTLANGRSPDGRRPLWKSTDARGVSRLHVDVQALLAAEISDFDSYVADLRAGASTALVTAFETRWDANWQKS